MRHEIWDKITPINGKEAIDIIGKEQIDNADQFVIFYENDIIIAIESVNTLKTTYGFAGITVDDIAAEYITRQSTSSVAPSIEERLASTELAILVLMEELG